MRVVPPSMTEAWYAEDKTGPRRPVVRATVQKTRLRKFDYDTMLALGDSDVFRPDRHRRGWFTSIIFGDPGDVKEIRNIKECTWSRSVGQDVAECTLTLKNTDLTPIGNQEEVAHADDFDLPGYMTYNRGEQTASVNRWGYSTETGWNGALVPDRLVKTYEGYGNDPTVSAGRDPNLLQSGTWLIDDAVYTSEGDITLKMRDVGRLLLDQICFPPVVPYSEYPLEWSRVESQLVDGRDAVGGTWQRPSGTTASSNDAYIGKGLSDPPYDHYVGQNGGWNGHLARHALDNRDGEWWSSTGQTTPNSKVWWEVELNDSSTAMAALRIHPQGGPYRIYVSLEGPKGWIGKKKIPYQVTTEGVDVKAGIPFVTSVRADRDGTFDLILPRKYAAVKRVRLTFAHLQDTGVGNYPFRAGLRDLQIYQADDVASLSFEKGKVMKVVGNYRDYTAIVKWVCAWGGFFWPDHASDMDFVHLSGQDREYITYAVDDLALPRGRVWGDFMQSGTAGEAALTVDLFDKQPLMNVINYVRDLLGFVFFIDETGGVVWRMPNLGLAGDPKKGNYLSPGHLGQRTRSRTAEFVTIDEEETLLSYETTLSSRNIRERIFVADTTGKTGTVVRGYNPYDQGFRRVAGWTDQNFDTKRDAKVMADMTAAQQMFDYRQSTVQIPGYPRIQIDDQVRIFERVTNETFFHYVEGIESTLNMETGVWTYDLTTHWLGENPSDAWVVRVDELDAVTQAYLGTVGAPE